MRQFVGIIRIQDVLRNYKRSAVGLADKNPGFTGLCAVDEVSPLGTFTSPLSYHSKTVVRHRQVKVTDEASTRVVREMSKPK
jgi:hypothetical protein